MAWPFHLPNGEKTTGGGGGVGENSRQTHTRKDLNPRGCSCAKFGVYCPFKPCGNSAQRIFRDGVDAEGNSVIQTHWLDEKILSEGYEETVLGLSASLMMNSGKSPREGPCAL